MVNIYWIFILFILFYFMLDTVLRAIHAIDPLRFHLIFVRKLRLQRVT